MQDNLKHKWQAAIKVNSEMLDETKRVVENNSFGTGEPDNILRIGLLQVVLEKKWTSERMPKLIVPEWYRNEIQTEIQNDAKEVALDRWHLEVAVRDRFRSVWDTVCCVNSLAEIFVDNPGLISTRNIYGMQRDLIDKIIDIPFIHREDERSRRYLEFLSYVSAPRKLRAFVTGNIAHFPEEFRISEVRTGIFGFLKLLDHYRVFGEHIVGANLVAVREVMLELIDLCNDVENLYDDLSEKGVRKILNKKMLRAENLFIALYVNRYFPEFGDWLKLSPKERDEHLPKLKSWIDLDHSQKLKGGLLQYIDDDEDFYNFNALGFKTSDVKSWCNRLTTVYNRFSRSVHDDLGIAYLEQRWTENDGECQRWYMLNPCAIALYMSATHLYECIGIGRDSDEMKSLQRMLRESQDI